MADVQAQAIEARMDPRGVHQGCPIGRRLRSMLRLPFAVAIVEPPSRERTSLRRAAL